VTLSTWAPTSEQPVDLIERVLAYGIDETAEHASLPVECVRRFTNHPTETPAITLSKIAGAVGLSTVIAHNPANIELTVADGDPIADLSDTVDKAMSRWTKAAGDTAWLSLVLALVLTAFALDTWGDAGSWFLAAAAAANWVWTGLHTRAWRKARATSARWRQVRPTATWREVTP
jgi:hypothetical protein